MVQDLCFEKKLVMFILDDILSLGFGSDPENKIIFNFFILMNSINFKI